MTFPAWGIPDQERHTPTASMQQSHSQSQANLYTSRLLSERGFRWPPGYGESLQQASVSLSSGDASATHLPDQLPFSRSPLRSVDLQYCPDKRFTESRHLHDPRTYSSNRFFNEDRAYSTRLQQLSDYDLESHHQQWIASLSHEGLRFGPRDFREPVHKSKATDVAMRQSVSEMQCVGSMTSTLMHPIASFESYRHSLFTLDPMSTKLASEHLNPDNFSVSPLKQIAQQNVIPETMQLAHTEEIYESPHYYIPRLSDLSQPQMESVSPSLMPKFLLDGINKHLALNQFKSVKLIPELTKKLDSKKSVNTSTFASLPVLLSLSDNTDSLDAVTDLNDVVDVVKGDALNEDDATAVENSNGSQSISVIAELAVEEEAPKKQKKDSEKGLPSYTSMIGQAILKRESSQSTLAEIYEYMEKNFPSLECRGTGWKNCVRHTLSLSDCFIKLHRSETGRSCNWAIHPSYFESFSKGDYRRRRALRKQRRGLQCMDPITMSAFSYMRDYDLAVDQVSSVRFYHYPHNLPAMWSSAYANCHPLPHVPLLPHYPSSVQGSHANMTGTQCIIPDCCSQARFRGYTAEYA